MMQHVLHLNRFLHCNQKCVILVLTAYKHTWLCQCKQSDFWIVITARLNIFMQLTWRKGFDYQVSLDPVSHPRWLLLLALLLVTIRIIASLLCRHTQLFQLYPHVVWECSPLMAQSHGKLSEQCTFLKNITRKKVCSVTGVFWKYDNICVDDRW